jgi:hypothetical protein
VNCLIMSFIICTPYIIVLSFFFLCLFPCGSVVLENRRSPLLEVSDLRLLAGLLERWVGSS